MADEQDQSFKITPPSWIKDVVGYLAKTSPGWIMLAITLWYGLPYVGRVLDAHIANETALIESYGKLVEQAEKQNEEMKAHVAASLRTQLFISVLCSSNTADSKA